MHKKDKNKEKKSRKDRNSKLSPTQRGLKLLRADGWTCGITEKWNPFAKIRQDLFGFIDFVAIKKGTTLGVQVTTGAHHAERRHKILASEKAKLWLEANSAIMILSFTERKRKDEKNFWEPRVEFITLEDFDNGKQKEAVTKGDKKAD